MRSVMLLLGAATLLGARAADEPIAFTVASWGKTLHEWQIEPDGRIHFSHAATGNFRDSTMVAQDTPPSRPRYVWVRKLLAPARKWTDSGLPCSVRVTDMPYGSIRWGDDKPLGFNAGFRCKDPEAEHAMKLIWQADSQMQVWIGKGPAPPAR